MKIIKYNWRGFFLARRQWRGKMKKNRFPSFDLKVYFPSELFSFPPTQSFIEMQIQSTSLACVCESLKLTTYCTTFGKTIINCLLMQMIRCQNSHIYPKCLIKLYSLMRCTFYLIYYELM